MASVPDSLSADDLYRSCPSDRFDFARTDELEDLTEIVGQARATEAIEFGLNIDREGYNVFALGPLEADKDRIVRHFLRENAADRPTPSDWAYVNNFERSDRPTPLKLPPGRGSQLQEDMESFVDDLETGLQAAFESEEYHAQRQVIESEVGGEHEQALEELERRAADEDLALLRTPAGFVFAPIRDGDVLSPDEVQQLSQEERDRIEEIIGELQDDLLQILRQVPVRHRRLHQRVRELNREVARYAVRDLIAELREKYADLDNVLTFLDEVEHDIVENHRDLLQQPGPGRDQPQFAAVAAQSRNRLLQQYQVNVLVGHEEDEGAPIVYEDHPTLQNLLGRVEYRSQMGTLVTDFSMIKEGALHRANGGYLMIDARKLLMQPLSWEALKRTLLSGELRIRSPHEELGLTSTTSLEPEPIPIDVKVVLLGDRYLYYLLHELDPEFGELFKVEADFDDRMDRTSENERLLARLVATFSHRRELRPVDADGVARIVEHAARLADDAEKLSLETSELGDLLEEANFQADRNGSELIGRTEVDAVLAARRRRAGRLRERTQEAILRDLHFIDTDGEAVGQINGLSVLELGNDRFGRPNRITATVRVGKGDVIDIEREVELGGPIHSKGVLILSSFLGARYSSDTPLSLSASLVFEQSYGGIEGDSASSAELYALLSAIAELPIRQSLAVTGSVNQHGKIQPIGGVNEKIEGYFDICRERGLTGDQGVLIPRANVKHLMLRREVVEAVREERFHVYPIQTVDQGLELLTGVEVGELDEEGRYPEDTINGRVARRLETLAEERYDYLAAESDGESSP